MPDETTGIPAAVIAPRRRVSAAWLVPVLAALLAAWLGYRAWSLRGFIVSVHLEDGHGLRTGDAVRYRGITVGEVRDIELAEGIDGIEVTATLRARADSLARAGSRFWVVRPQVTFERVSGVETLIGPRYLAVLPGGGSPQRRFVGLPEPPPVESIRPGDLEVMLEARARGALRVGAPVTYRQVRVGTVLSVGLTGDAGAVEARIHVRKPYARLITPATRFWGTGGVKTNLGLSGLSLEIDSLQELIAGGVALATPADAPPMVRTGHRFPLLDAPRDEWLEWEPLIALGSDLLPPGTTRPDPRRGAVGWREGWIFKGQRSRRGWMLPTDQGVLAPADLLAPDDGATDAVLEVGGAAIPLPVTPRWRHGEIAMADVSIEAGRWPYADRRAAAEPEECLVFADPSAAPIPLAVGRLEVASPAAWTVDRAVPLDDDWHGACVLARRDGALIGLLVIGEDGDVSVALLPEG